MNKYFIIIILIVLSYQTKAQYFEIHQVESRDQFDREFVFPIISNSNNKAAAKKINNILQFEILDTNYASNKDNIFNNLSEDGMHGVTKINYEIKENSQLFLSIIFKLETLGAYNDLITMVYNFNSATGDFIDFSDVFDENQMDWIHDRAKYKFIQVVVNTMKSDYKYSSESGKILEDEVFQSYAGLFDCIQRTQFYNFHIRQNSIIFDRHYCFNRGRRAFEPNFSYSISTKEIPEFVLTPLGNELLKSNIPILEWKNYLDTGKLIISGKIDNKYNFVASLNHNADEEEWRGTYWYTKYGKPIELRGFIDDEGYLLLKEENGEFRIEVNDNILSTRGIWKDNSAIEYIVTIE